MIPEHMNLKSRGISSRDHPEDFYQVLIRPDFKVHSLHFLTFGESSSQRPVTILKAGSSSVGLLAANAVPPTFPKNTLLELSAFAPGAPESYRPKMKQTSLRSGKEQIYTDSQIEDFPTFEQASPQGLLFPKIQMKFLLLMSLYLIGYARGASGQPDESPGSMAHQASVQQLSGEYFSLGNPSDGEALYETAAGENTLSEHTSGEHTSVEHAAAEHSSTEHTSGEHASGEHTSGERATGEHTSGEHATSEHTSGEQPSGEQPSGEKSSGEQPSGEQSSGEKPSAEQTSGEQAVAEKPSGEQAVAERPSGEQASNEKASSEQASAEQASAEQASSEQASSEKPLGEQPSGIPPSSTFSGPILNCHTCSYMNDQGKCLRGEGVCSTQNSQQCMLKKIFEGGKLQFMVQGCENMCPSMNLFSHGTRMQIICCRNQSFCNKI
nr:acrosomal protein SP-10 [Nyctereutes procyonoides]